MDLGIINAIKASYKGYVSDFITGQILGNEFNMKSCYNSLTLLDVCHWVRESTKEIKPAFYYNYWKKLMSLKEKLQNEELFIDEIQMSLPIENLNLTFNEETEEMDNSLMEIDEVICEEYISCRNDSIK